jgi:photosystem II stability/assembly factor-like uncharacterized protein
MKSQTAIKIFIMLSGMLASLPQLQAQWMALSSGTTHHLHDIFFLNEDYGVAVGDSSTVLLTTNGGDNWLPIASDFKESFQSVLILAPDSILIAGGNYFNSSIYRTPNGGFDWNFVSEGIQLAQREKMIYALHHETIYRSSDRGTKWKSSVIIIAGTILLEKLYFPGNGTGYALGNISGFNTYSTYGFRTIDGGANWKPLLATDFPNANAYTAAFFPHPDTGYVFTNAYVNFEPGTDNQLVRVTDFVFDEGLSQSWRFFAEIINSDMPANMTDAYFFDSQTGYACGQDGNIYKTTDGGVSWTVDYEGSTPLEALYFVDSGTGFATGRDGTILKWTGGTSAVSFPEKYGGDVRFFPNPACGQLTIELPAPVNATLRLFNNGGQLVRQARLTQESMLSLQELPAGVYLAEVRAGDAVSNRKIVVDNGCKE